MVEHFDEHLFLGYLEGDLTPAEVERFEKQLLADARLRNLVAQLVLDRHRMRTMPDEEPPPQLFEPVQQQLERRMLLDAPASPVLAKIGRRTHYRFMRWASFGTLAAAILLALSLFYLPLSDYRLLYRATSEPTDDAEAPAVATGPTNADFAPPVAAAPSPTVPMTHPEPTARASASRPTPAPTALALADTRSALREELGRDQQFVRVGKAEPAPPADDEHAGARRLSATSAELDGLTAGAAPPTLEKSQDQPAAAEDQKVDHDTTAPTLAEHTGEVELRVTTTDVRASREQVLQWAAANRVPTVSTAAAEPPAGRDLALVLAPRQVPQLVAHLNTRQGQRAQVVEQVALKQSVSAALRQNTAQASRKRDHQERSDAAPAGAGFVDANTLDAAADALTLSHTAWGRILNEQLPLGWAMPLADARATVILPVVIEPMDAGLHR